MPQQRMKNEKKKWEMMMFILATHIIASRLPERRRTGTPTARASFSNPSYGERVDAILLACQKSTIFTEPDV